MDPFAHFHFVFFLIGCVIAQSLSSSSSPSSGTARALFSPSSVESQVADGISRSPGLLTVTAPTCPARRRVVVTVTPTVTSCPGRGNTCTWATSSTSNAGATTITTVITLCFTCALTPTVVTSTYTGPVVTASQSATSGSANTQGGSSDGTRPTSAVSGSAISSNWSLTSLSTQSGSAATQATSSAAATDGPTTITVTIVVTGQTTITQGQTITITQASGVVTVTQFENGTITLAEPTLTVPGPTVTAQGPTVTAQGPTVTVQAPTVTVQGPTATAQGPTVTVEGPTVTAEGPTVTEPGPTKTVTTMYGQGSTALPDCPNEKPGRIFDSPYGGEYAIFCGYAYLDPDQAVVTSASLGSCAQACDAYNIQHFYDTTTCAGITYFNSTGECHLKANMTIPHATDGADSAQLLNPYKGGITQVFASSTNMGPMASGPTVTYTSPVVGYTSEPLVNCPQDNNTVVIAGSDSEAFIIECSVNRLGADLPDAPYFVSSFRSCIDACANDRRCYDSTYFPSGAAMNPCFLKANVTTPTKDDTCWNARLLTGPTCPRDNGKLYVTQGQNFVVECYTDHAGCNFAQMPILTDSFGACMDLCAANSPACTDASWTPGTPHGSCTLKSCVGSPIANQTDVWGGRLLNGTGSTVTTVQTVPTTLVQTQFQTVLVSVTTTLTLTTTSDGVPVTLTSTQTLVSTQTAPVATQTVTTDRLVTTTLYSGDGGGNGTNGYPNATATVTTTVGSGYITVTVTAFPSSSSSTFSCLTHMTNYLPASASGGMRVKRNEFLFPELEVRRRAEIGARTVRAEDAGLGWVI